MEKNVNENMTVQELENIMQKYGAVIRAIPYRTQEIYEAAYKDRFPDGEIRYLEGYDRNMLVVEKTPENSGKFMVETAKHTGSMIRFSSGYFNSLEEVAEALTSGEIRSPHHKERKK